MLHLHELDRVEELLRQRPVSDPGGPFRSHSCRHRGVPRGGLCSRVRPC